MKKAIISVLIVLIIGAAAYGGYYWYENYYKKASIEQLLPGGAVVYWKENNAAESFQRFTQTELWKKLSGVDIQKLLASSDVDQKTLAMVHFLMQRVGSLPQDLALNQYFGNEFAVAFYPVPVTSMTPMALLELAGGVGVVTRLSADDQFIGFVDKAFRLVGQEYVSRTYKYNGHDVTEVTAPQFGIPELKLVFTRIEDYVFIGAGEDMARSVIDVAAGAKAPLAADANFNIAKASFQRNAQSISYVNMEIFFKEFKQQLTALASLDQSVNEAQKQELEKQVEKSFESMQGFKAIGTSTVYDQMVRLRSDYYYAPAQLAPRIQKLYNCAPKDNQTIKFVPANALAYQWSDCNDLGYYWEEIKGEMTSAGKTGEGPSPQVALAGVENFLGVDVEKDLLPALGIEQGWILSDIDSSGPFPFPKLLFFIKTLNQETIAGILEKITNQPFLFVQSDSYKGFDIKFVTIPVGAEIQPAYTFVDGYLLFSSNTGLLKDCINAREDQKLSLISDPSLQEMDLNFTDKNNGMLFIKLRQLMGEVKGALDWGTGWYLAKVRQMEAYKSGSQQRLVDVNDQMQTLHEQLSAVEEDLRFLEEQKVQAVDQGGDVLGIHSSIEQVNKKMADMKNSLQALESKQKELQDMVETFQGDDTVDSRLLEVYMKDGLYPFLEAIGSVKLIGTKMTMKNSVIETISAFKME